MIITRTPVRVSLFGGSTDYPAWYKTHGGAVLNATIDKYSYISIRSLPPFFEHKSRIVWSRIENVQGVEEIQHPSARECLKYMGITQGIEIHHDGDVPARTGLGTSSAFTVGLLNALHTMKGEQVGKFKLALEAIHVERDLIGESVGDQDQLATAIGGLNFMQFGEGEPLVMPIDISQKRMDELQACLMLVFTGFPHMASNIAKTYEYDKTLELKGIHRMAIEARSIVQYGNILDFGRMLDESWQFKKAISKQISNPYIDYVYNTAKEAGALGGKIIGAGGGGFMLLFAPPEAQKNIREKLGGLLYVPFKFENRGTQVIFQNGDGGDE